MALWLVSSAIAVFFALIIKDSAVVDGAYIPRTNDSFYHARRILDAAIGTRGFYQFDERLHVPDGTWIPWPWAYDYLMAKLVQVGTWLVPGLDPLALMSHVPVVWILVNAALSLAAVSALGLSFGMRVLVMLGFALSPLTQLLHGIAMIDHHYVEHTFVLLNFWLGVSWFRNVSDARWATALALTLGVAPAFHNGLFILQLAPLAAMFLLWVNHRTPPMRVLLAFGIALVGATQLVLLPSAPYRSGLFEFGLLSWFHFYVACCTAIVCLYLGWRPYSFARLGWLCVLGVVLVLPLAAQVFLGAQFLSGDFSILSDIVEARSPYRLFTDTYGPVQTASYYSWLLLLTPVLVVHSAWCAVRTRRPEVLYFSAAAVLGLCLMLAQFRFHYFGLLAMLGGLGLALDQLRERFRWHAGAVFVGGFAGLALALQPALKERLFVVYAAGSSPHYAAARPLFLELGERCESEPGVVLASSDDGNPILFHTDCSVLSNNFVLRTEDEAKIAEIGRLMRLPPDQIRRSRPDIKYLLVRASDFSTRVDGIETLATWMPVAQQLFVEPAAPAGYTLLREVTITDDDGGHARPYARLFGIRSD